MTAIVDFPSVVQEALIEFGPLFKNEPERQHFAEYLTGLIVANKKNVSDIHRLFVFTSDQSCLNRWITTDGLWDVEALNDVRLAWLQKDPTTAYSVRGVIAIDNTLIDHDGKFIEDVGWFWDHAEGRNKIAHDYLIAHYVCVSGKHYPLEFRRFVKKDACLEGHKEFRDHNVLFRELIDWTVAHDIPGDFTFDSYFTHAANLNHIHNVGRAYVGDLKFNRKILFQGQLLKASELAQRIGPEDRKLVTIGEDRQWYFTKRIKIPEVAHPVRIVILWSGKNETEAQKMLIGNRTIWDVTRILRVYRRRWCGTECFHRDGKQHLGMGDCQLRNGLGQPRHMYMVFLAYSVLMRQMRQGRVSEWARERLKTIGQACGAVLKETLGDTITWVVNRLNEGWNGERIKRHLALP